jgi:hypothetical protein
MEASFRARGKNLTRFALAARLAHARVYGPAGPRGPQRPELRDEDPEEVLQRLGEDNVVLIYRAIV